MADLGTMRLLWSNFMPGPNRPWVLEASIANHNDTNITATKRDVQDLAVMPGQVVLRELHVTYLATTTGANMPLNVQVGLYNHPIIGLVTAFLGAFNTTTTYAHFDWQGELPVRWRELASDATEVLLINQLAAPGALDDCWVWMHGDYYQETQPQFQQPTPVSLEGYKWPLTRR